MERMLEQCQSNAVYTTWWNTRERPTTNEQPVQKKFNLTALKSSSFECLDDLLEARNTADTKPSQKQHQMLVRENWNATWQRPGSFHELATCHHGGENIRTVFQLWHKCHTDTWELYCLVCNHPFWIQPSCYNRVIAKKVLVLVL